MSVGLNTTFNNFGYNQSFGNNLGLNSQYAGGAVNNNFMANGSLFAGNPLQPVANNYEDDFMMPAFLKTDVDQSYPENTQVSGAGQDTKSTSFTGDKVTSANTETAAANNFNEELKNYSLDNIDKGFAVTDKGNPYKKTDASKKTFAVLGFLAPLAGRVIQWAKGGKFSELFKCKQLAVACPIVALAGYGIGTLIDSYINNQRAKAVDAPAENQNSNVENIQ